ncbi:MAG TPA: glycosyltransferase [Candidatus Saccharimonadales bacterium]|nr:glycosyltransferase [Candidatus Saccharimonadales bacterium]
MKIGILAHDFITWTGGVDFLGLVIDSLLTAPQAAASKLQVIIPDRKPTRKWFKGAPRSAKHIPDGLGEFKGRLPMYSIETDREELERVVRRLKLDAVLPAFHALQADFSCPWVGYAYDFQHKYFPDLFREEDRRYRNEHFLRILTETPAVIVNSRSVLADIRHFVPEATAKVFVLPFAPAPQPQWKASLPETLARHSVTAPFFLISNQFWIHKDHSTAFEAFRQIASRHPNVSLICTGSTSDPRDPAYFPALMSKVKDWGLESRLRVLGLIPKRDQIELMKNACAVLQPTRFEGGPGGGSVYDAVALRVPALVSDIPVNREITAPGVEFFPVGDATTLAQKMEKALAAPPRIFSWSKLWQEGRQRRAACGKVLWQAIDCVVK